MAFDFANAPSNGQIAAGPGGISYTWDGTKWASSSAGGVAYAPLASPVFTGDPQAPTPASTDSDTSIATTAFVAAAVAPFGNNTGRNLVHNGQFNVAQRGVGPFSTSGYTLDRWSLYLNTDAVSISQQPATVSADEAATRCLSNVFTGNAGTNAQHILYQPIEGVQRLAGKTVTVSFYAVATAGTPKLAVSLDQAFGTGGSPHARVNGAGQATTPLTAGWVRYSFTFAVPTVAGFTIGTNGDSNTALTFWYSNGVAADATRSANIGVQSGTVGIWGVQLEIGSTATPLAKRDPADELALCQRMFCIGQYATIGYVSAGANYLGGMAYLPVAMRANPTIALTGTPAGDVNVSAANAPDTITPASFRFSFTSTAAGTLQGARSFSASADL